MKAIVPDYTTDKGIAIMMEHFAPGQGGRHRQTRSYGTSPNLNLSPREALAQEVWDVRSIYCNQGLYNKEIRKSLQQIIRLNKAVWSSSFNKTPKIR